MIEPAAQGHFRWWILLTIAVSSLCSGIVVMAFAPLIGEVARDLNVDLGTASFSFIGMTMFVSAVGIGLIGFLVDRIGIFPVIISGQLLILFSIAAIPAFGDHFSWLIVIRILQGLGSAALTAAISPAVALWFPPGEMGRAMGLQSIGMALGIALGLNAGPALAQALGGWQMGIGILSLAPLMALAITIPIAIASRLHPPLAHNGPRLGEPVQSSDFLRVPVFWIGLGALCLCYWVGLAFNGLAPGFLAVSPPVGAGYGSQGAGSLMLLFTLAGVVGPPLGGLLIDKLFGGRSSPLIAIGWIVGAIFYSAVLLPSVHDSRIFLGVALLAAGLSNPFINVTLMSYSAKVFPPHVVGRVAGIWLSLSFLAGAGGVMVCSLALRATGSYTVPFLIIGISSLIGLATTPFLKPPMPTQRAGTH